MNADIMMLKGTIEISVTGRYWGQATWPETLGRSGLSVLVSDLVLVSLTQDLLIWEERTLTEEMPLADWPIDECVGTFS